MLIIFLMAFQVYMHINTLNCPFKIQYIVCLLLINKFLKIELFGKNLYIYAWKRT